jgi:hypothetical protein
LECNGNLALVGILRAKNHGDTFLTSSFFNSLYPVLSFCSFGSTTAGYATWLAMGVVMGEIITGKGTDMMWRSVNYGKTFDTVDWSKFDPEDEDEEEEEEEEEDDDE